MDFGPNPIPNRASLFGLSKRPYVIHHVPHIFVADTRTAVNAFHGSVNTDAIPDIDENLTVRGSVIPLVIGQVGRLGLSGLGELLSLLADAVSSDTMALSTVFVVHLVAGINRFFGRGN